MNHVGQSGSQTDINMDFSCHNCNHHFGGNESRKQCTHYLQSLAGLGLQSSTDVKLHTKTCYLTYINLPQLFPFEPLVNPIHTGGVPPPGQ